MADALVALSSRHAGRIGLALLWMAAGVAALAPPDAAQHDASAQPALRRVMEPVAMGVAVAVAAAPDGDVWWVTRDRAVRFGSGEPGLGSIAAGSIAQHPGRRGGRGPITAAHVGADGALWLGTRHGSLWSYHEGAWREHTGSFRGAPIRAIATRDGRVYVGATGLWRGSTGADVPLQALPAFANVPILHVAAHPRHGVAVAGRDRVWRGDSTGWREVWRTHDARDAATTVALSPEGELWIGSRDGLVRIDRDGRARRDLPGVRIASVATREDGAIYAGTHGAGLLQRYAGGWRRVDDAGGHDVSHVTGLASAPGGALWLALGDGGLLRAGPGSAALPHVALR
jgi:ligand-binding sensor domain-containing protein